MDLTILGSGTAVPVPDRFPAGVLIQGAGQTVVVDLGPGVLRRLAQAGVSPVDLDAVLITHFHTDHTADIAALLFALRNPNVRRDRPLRLIGPVGLAELVTALQAAWRWLVPRGYELGLEEIAPGRGTIGALTYEAVDIDHTPESLAYRFQEPGGAVLAVSGDALPCDGLVEVARGAGLFVCEAAFPSSAPGMGHLTPELAARAARAAGVHTLCLTHFYPECDGHDLAAEARREFSGRVVLAHDLLRLRVDAAGAEVLDVSR